MQVVKKIAAAIVMLVSVVLLIAFLVGIAGTWIVRNDAIALVADVATLADHSLQRAQTGLGRVETGVSQLQTKLDTTVSNIEAAGNKVEETNLALAAADAVLDKDLTPAILQLQDTMTDVRERVAVLDDTINLMQRLPFARESKLVNVADTLIERLKAFDQSVQEARQAIKSTKSNVTEEAVAVVTKPLRRASTTAGVVNDDLGQLDARLVATQGEIQALRQRFNTMITWAAVIGTLACLWLALAQLGLFLHGLGLFTGKDPLARWHRASQG